MNGGKESTPESLAHEIKELHRSGRANDAFALALESAERFPSSSLALTNLGYFYVTRGEPALALQAYESAVHANPGNAEARRGLAVAKTQCGIAAQGDSVTVVPYRGAARAVRVLVPITLGTGNVVTENLFDDRVFEVIKIAVELHPLDAALPQHDVVFNAVGEADSSRGALERASALLAHSPRRILNDPERIARTGRVEQARRLRVLDGVTVPRIERVTKEGARGLPFPVLLRVPGYHAGEHFVRVTTDEDLDDALAQLPGDELFAIAYADTRDAGGCFAKYRVMAIDGRLYPLHLAISREWKVHYFSAAMAADPSFREREARFLENPAEVLGARAWQALRRIADLTALEYAGIDFSLDGDGNVVLFECNATMAVRYPREEPLWAYRRPAVDAALDAVRAMLLRYSPSI